MDNSALVMINDLKNTYGIKFHATGKDNKESYIAEVRTLISNNQIFIHPRCKTLIYHLSSVRFKKTGSHREFMRMPDTTERDGSRTLGGHADGADALIYMVRNIDKTRDLKRDSEVTYRFNREQKRVPEYMKAIASIFNRKI